MRKRLARQTPSRLPRKRSSARRKLLGEGRIIGRIDHHRDVVPVLGRRAHQRRAADVNILDRVVEAHAGARDRAFERIEVDHHEIDRLDPMLAHLALMIFVGAPRQDAAVNLRMERLDPSVEHLGRTREVLDSADLDAVRFQSRRGAAS